jgi:transketolase
MTNMRQTFSRVVTEIALNDPSVVVLVADISHGIFYDFREKIEGRYFNMGICEPSIVNIAAGLNKVGINPVVHTIAPFLIERSYEQIKLDFGYQNLNVNLVSVGGSFDYSKLGCSHHCYEDAAILKHFERCQIFLPGSNKEFEILFKQHYKDNNINYFRITEYPHDVNLNFNLKKREYCYKIKDGEHLTLVALGNQLRNVYKAAEILQSNYKINAEIIYFNALKPFHFDIFNKSIKKTGKFLCVEELSKSGGLYEECLKSLLKANIEKIIKSDQIAINDFIYEYGSYEDLCKVSGLDVENIIARSSKLM